MKKKTLILLMVCILALSMPATVFAADSFSTTIRTIYEEPDIEISVPTAGQLFLNPKGLPLVVDGQVEDGQIISTPWSIENRSKVAVSVNAEVYADINRKSDLMLISRSLTGITTRAKRAFIYMDMRVTDPGVSLSSLDWDQTVYDGKGQILVTDVERTRNNIMTLAPATANGSASPGGVGAFRLSGDAVPNPSEAWDPDVDNIKVYITFTFRPTGVPAA